MKFTTIAVAALSLAFLAACGKNDERPAASGSSATPRDEAGPQTTPAPVTASAITGKSDSCPPVDRREDTRQPVQRRDFEHPDTGGK
jgi:hypothetical protein